MESMLSKQLLDAWASVVAKAWEDDEFKEKLLADPTDVLGRLGYNFYDEKGEKMTIKIVSGSTSASEEPDTIILPFPEKPETLNKIEIEAAHPGVCT